MEEASKIFNAERHLTQYEVENQSFINRQKHAPIIRGREPSYILDKAKKFGGNNYVGGKSLDHVLNLKKSQKGIPLNSQTRSFEKTYQKVTTP